MESSSKSAIPGSYKILAVDDEPIVHQMLEQMISESGLPVVISGTASSGVEALVLASELRPDICILDIEMPGMNGLELAERITSAGISPRIIYLTGYDRFEYAQQALRLCAADYLLKPIVRKELIAVLTRIVNQLHAERIEHAEHEKLRDQLKMILPSAVPDTLPTPTERHYVIAKQVRDFIDEHMSEKVSLTTAAEHVCLSPDYLGSIFKSTTGMSFKAYIRSVRIARAKELMQDHKLNLTQIAQTVGYEDLNYFSQVFFKETGIRPSEYRGGGGKWVK